MDKYVVQQNFCNCHPETCCCNDWVVVGPEGRVGTWYRHEDAQRVADHYNESLQLKEELHKKEQAMSKLEIRRFHPTVNYRNIVVMDDDPNRDYVYIEDYNTAISQLEKALKPFAELARVAGDGCQGRFYGIASAEGKAEITYEDCRAALTLLNNYSEKTDA